MTSSDTILARPGLPRHPITQVVRFVRPADQVDLRFEFLNLIVDGTSNTLQRVDPTDSFAAVRIVFGPQHTVEDPIGTGDLLPVDARDHRRAAETRVVIELPEGTPFTVEELLALAKRTLVLDNRADPGAKPAENDDEPTAEVTALEVVESLVFSPDSSGRFVADPKAVTHGDVTELWRARLGAVNPSDEAGGVVEPNEPGLSIRPAVRAIWSRPGDPPFDRPVDEGQREMIRDATISDPALPIEVDRLWLTSHGAFIDLVGTWADGVLASYQHHTTAGRDLHVEVVERGFLAPFGHEATVTRVTERQVRVDEGDGLTAALIQDDYVAVVTPTVAFPANSPAPFMPDAGRALPFTEVTVAGLGSGPVGKATIALTDDTSINPENAWVVTRDGEDVRVAYTATDRGGEGGISFELPAVFVAEPHAFIVQDEVDGVTTVLGRLAQYFREAPDDRRQPEIGGQPVTWADPADHGPAGSVRSTARVRLTLDRPSFDPATTPAADVRADLEAIRRPAFYPRVERAWVIDEAGATLMGGTAELEVEYAEAWIAHGNEPDNPGLSFHTLVTETSLDRQGTGQGLVRPAFKVTTFGQVLGGGVDLTPPQGLAARAGGGGINWDPGQALEGAATLFGNIVLTEIVEEINIGLDQIEGEKGLPRYEIKVIEGDGPLDPPLGFEYILSWEPKLKTWPDEEPVFIIADELDDFDLPEVFDGDSKALIKLTHVAPVEGSGIQAGTEFEARIENVALRLPPVEPAIAIMFAKIRYFEPIGGTSQLETHIAEWMFIGTLEFLEPIRQFVMTLLDLGNIEIGPDGISADVEIPVPSLSFGIVGVRRLSVGLALELPNEGSSEVGFNLSRRDDPFRITLFGFGGSGSFEMAMVAEDIVLLYGSLAVTYELAASIVIASVSLSASVGIDLKYEKQQVILGAFVELVGNASILGVVDVTGKVLLGLKYNFTTKVLKGTAQVTAEVDSLFGKSDYSWKETVEVPLGSGGAANVAALLAPGPSGPTVPSESFPATSFADRFDSSEWSDYCAAFA
jgi:hypothetical protein